MSTREDKPKEYFARLLDIPEEEIDYSEIPRTENADWDESEILFPVTAEEFQAIKRFIRKRRERAFIAAEASRSE